MNVDVLDHYYLRLANGCIFAVVGNAHLDYGFIGYVKYCQSERDSPIWVLNGLPLERVVKWYEVQEVHEGTPWKIYVPYYDAELPYAPVWLIERVYNPVERMLEIIASPRDALEEKAATIASYLASLAGDVKKLGVTGSLLPGIHNPLVSDIDLVVYGWRDSPRVIEAILENKDVFKPFNGDKLRDWATRISERTGLTRKQALALYRNWRRGVFIDRDYSVIYNSGIVGLFHSKPRYRTIGVTTIEATLAGGIEALNYPSVSGIERYRVLSGANPPLDITFIESLEALYIPVLYEGGSVVAKGLLQCNMNECRVLVGVIEEEGFVIPTQLYG